MKNKITMHQAIFYKLYEAHKRNPEEYIPVWSLIGEVFIHQISQWAYVSYEIPARMSEVWNGNPKMLERRYTTGRSGSKYYEYRIRVGGTPADIKDPTLLSFYNRVKGPSVLVSPVDNSIDKHEG